MLKMKKNANIILLVLLLVSIQSFGQSKSKPIEDWDRASFGLGLGFDYGGIGANATVYPQKNLGLFLGAGYAMTQLGYNVGVKLRGIPSKKNPDMAVYALAMYGYHAVVKVTDAEHLNEMFYGATLGFGFDFKGKKNDNYLSLALLVPLRGDEVDNYMDELEDSHGVTFKNSLPPVGISIGYKFMLSK
jgi:hypothetical protein